MRPLPGFVRIPEMTSLALHSMAVIAANQGRVVTVKEMAAVIGSSEAHLAKVMQRLVKARLAHSSRGPAGGFTLAEPAASITLLHIYEAIEGKPDVHQCPLGKEDCAFEQCIFGGVLEHMEEEILRYLSGRTLASFSASLARREKSHGLIE